MHVFAYYCLANLFSVWHSKKSWEDKKILVQYTIYEILSEGTLELTYSTREKIIISMYLVNLYV